MCLLTLMSCMYQQLCLIPQGGRKLSSMFQTLYHKGLTSIHVHLSEQLLTWFSMLCKFMVVYAANHIHLFPILLVLENGYKFKAMYSIIGYVYTHFMKVLDAANKLRDGKIGTLFRTINAATVEGSTHYTVMSKICGFFY